ncbi:MAG: formate dehydrogenase accessory sulfurtransferase FdhD [Methylococcales bacterium]|nr:formate dehydrogenase accessory sulfurtransferase FdhD [Methylococcales bacterium]MDD5753728.1 formate dehydrogenase accessory sulfurtransferase FdhD [Methylococcales bacterium]
MANDEFLASVLELGWSSYQSVPVERWKNGECSTVDDFVAEEVPVVLMYNGVSHVVMLATPTNLEDFALGFSLTEGIIANAAELESVKVYQRSNGIEVQLKIPEARFQCLADKGRNLTGRTGCGLCGATTLKQAIKPPRSVSGDLKITAAQLTSALQNLSQHQKLNQLTGAIHAVAWVAPENGIVELREDVGRHNALDKLIGSLLKRNTDFGAGFMITTSRASYEMVQKATAVGVTILAAISAPTALAIRLAQESGLTLIGFARDNSCVIYSHSQRFAEL